MQASAGFISGIVEFSSGMERRKYETRGRHSFFVHADRDSPAIVGNGAGTVFF